MNAAAYLLDNGLTSDNVVLLTDQGDYTYSQLESASWSVAGWLTSNGVVKGDRALILAESGFFWAASYLGTMLAGAVAVPLSGTMKRKNLGKVFAQVDPTAVFIQGKFMRNVAGLLNNGCEVVVDTATGPGSGDSVSLEQLTGIYDGSWTLSDACPVDDGVDLASIMYTSGSTGDPRGVMITHRNIRANTDSILKYMELTRDDRVMAVLPFHYCYGLSLLHTHLKTGGSVVVQNSFMFPEVILNRIEETGCTGFAGVPSTYQILLRSSSLKKRSFPSLKYVQQAGGKLTDIFLMELMDALPGKNIFVMYGQTEATARLSFLPPSLLEEKLGSIGCGILGVTLDVVDEKGSPVKPEEVGEIVAHGDNIALGYWKDDNGTQDTFRDGKLHTGDLAAVDEEGFIYIVDRAADFLKCGGYRISSKEVESVVLEFPGTVEAAVVRQPDEKLGEAVRLYVVHEKGQLVEKDLERHCAKKLEWSFLPRKVFFLETLPKTQTGKIDKESLNPEIFDYAVKASDSLPGRSDH